MRGACVLRETAEIHSIERGVGGSMSLLFFTFGTKAAGFSTGELLAELESC
jgi:hypothetical protein